ncbi:hypothetical protein HDU76_006743 [Blyttiomyces sp. JEL0837]|nr:hypothetical protein HDU76_006743 [Blyttiomyces sp. JEL0837]
MTMMPSNASTAPSLISSTTYSSLDERTDCWWTPKPKNTNTDSQLVINTSNASKSIITWPSPSPYSSSSSSITTLLSDSYDDDEDDENLDSVEEEDTICQRYFPSLTSPNVNIDNTKRQHVYPLHSCLVNSSSTRTISNERVSNAESPSMSGDDMDGDSVSDSGSRCSSNGTTASGKSISFSDRIDRADTFSDDEYDRSSVPVAKLRYYDIAELMTIKSEMAKEYAAAMAAQKEAQNQCELEALNNEQDDSNSNCGSPVSSTSSVDFGTRQGEQRLEQQLEMMDA